MSCDHCPGTVWFDHAARRWKHAPAPVVEDVPVALCSKPSPYFVGNHDERFSPKG